MLKLTSPDEKPDIKDREKNANQWKKEIEVIFKLPMKIILQKARDRMRELF